MPFRSEPSAKRRAKAARAAQRAARPNRDHRTPPDVSFPTTMWHRMATMS